MFGTMGQTNVKNLGNGGTMDGDVTITGDLTVSGGISLSLNEVLQGTSTIDINSTEALLVRKDSDGGDVFIVDTTNSKVGVNVTSPSVALHVSGDIQLDDTAPFLLFKETGSNKDMQFKLQTDGRMSLLNDNASTEVLTVLQDGSVGIGTASPYSPLHIKSSAEGSIGGLEGTDGTFIPQVVIEGSGTTAAKMSPTLALFNSSTGADGDTLGSIMFMGGDSTTQPPTTPANASVYAGILAKITDETNSSNDGELHFLATKGNDNTNTAMSIVGSNVGIGNTSPATALDIKGTDNTSSKITITNTSGTDNIWSIHANYNTQALTFTGDSAEVMTLLDTGKVGIGISTPTQELEIKFATDKHMLFSDSQGETGNCPTIHTVNTAGSALVEFGIRASEIRLATGSAKRMVLDDNSRISLSNNDGGASNTVFGKLAGNALASGGNYNLLIGEDAGNDLTTSDHNVAIGFQAFAKATANLDGNTVLGNYAMGSVVSNDVNNCVVLGYNAVGIGVVEAGASGMTAIGYQALKDVTSGINVGVGFEAGRDISTGTQNTLIGYQAGHDLQQGGRNTAVGHLAFGGSLDANGDESFDNTFIGFGSGAGNWVSAVSNKNTAVGSSSMQGAMNGSLENVAVGYESLKALTTGDNNTAVGSKAMLDVTTGSSNVALGKESAQNLTDGQENVIIGDGAGQTTTSVHDVVVVGRGAMQNGNVTNDADGTVAVGYKSLEALTSGQKNTAIGFESLKTNVDGDQNTAVGYQSLTVFEANADGEGKNTAVGNASGINVTTGQNNTLIGVSTGANTVALTTGSDNTLVGSLSDVSTAGASNQTVLGKGAKGVADNSVTLGNADVTAVYMAEDSGATVHCAGVVVSEGINFPDDAATGHSSDVNTLDNYEEGTWTATDGSGAGLSLTLEENTYVKIGRLVTAHMIVTFPTTSDTNLATLTLPFNAESIGSSAGGAVLEQNVNTANMYTACVNGTNACIFRLNGGTAQTNANVSGKKLRFVITYMS